MAAQQVIILAEYWGPHNIDETLIFVITALDSQLLVDGKDWDETGWDDSVTCNCDIASSIKLRWKSHLFLIDWNYPTPSSEGSPPVWASNRKDPCWAMQNEPITWKGDVIIFLFRNSIFAKLPTTKMEMFSTCNRNIGSSINQRDDAACMKPYL